MTIQPRSFATGGGLWTTVDPYFLSSDTEETSTRHQSSESNKNEDKDLEDELKYLFQGFNNLEALDSDLEVIMRRFQQVYRRGQNQLLMPGESRSTNGLVAAYMEFFQNKARAKNNQQEYEKAEKVVTDNKGLSEIAITSDNKVIVVNRFNGQQDAVSVSEFLNNRMKYDEITNQDLLDQRRESPMGAFNNQLLSVVKNGVGLEKVQEQIKSALMELGSTSRSEDISFEIKNGAPARGAEILVRMMQSGINPNVSIDGLYQGNISTKDNAQQIEAALDYIYSMLPDQSKTLLQLKGNDARNPDVGAKKMICNLLLAKQSSNHSYTYTITTPTEKKGSNSGSNENGDYDGDEKLNTVSIFMMGGGEKSQFTIQDGSMQGFKVDVNTMSITDGSKPLGTNVTLAQLAASPFGAPLDFKNASCADSFLLPEQFDKIIIPDGKLSRVELPIDPNEAARGFVKPDFNALKRKEEADDILRREGIDTRDRQQIAQNYIRINQIYASKNLPAMCDAAGNVNAKNYKTFAVVSADVYSGAIQNGKIASPNRVKEIKGDNKDRIIKIVTKINDYKSDDDWFSDPLFGTSDKYYQGTIFIPASTDYWAAQSGTGEKVKAEEYNALEGRNIANQRKQQLESMFNNYENYE